ncbi:hypothetical protein D3C87_1583150 [compost metagenome]
MLEHDRIEQHGGQLEVFEARNVEFDVARHDRHIVALLENIDPKAPDTRQRDCQVHLQFPVELQALFGVHDGRGNSGDFPGFERLIGQGFEHAIEPRAGWRARGQV